MFGQVDDEALLSLYAEARIVAVTAAGEDLGYVPLEAFLSGKPVLTTEDAGGPLEFVEGRRDGHRHAPRGPRRSASRCGWPGRGPTPCARWGRRGGRRAALLDWDGPIAALLAAAGLA